MARDKTKYNLAAQTRHCIFRNGIILKFTILVFGFFIFFFLLVSCQVNSDVNSKEERIERLEPNSISFDFANEKPIEWHHLDSNSLSKPKSNYLNLNTLSSSHFKVNGFRKLKSSAKRTKFDWSSLDKEILGLDTLSNKNYQLKKYLLPSPRISKVEIPVNYSSSNNGLMQFVDENGHLGTAITAMVEDKNGIKWIASENGLSQYKDENLYTFDIFNQEGNANDRIVNKMILDQSGRIWIATAGFGIFIIDIEKGIILKDNLRQKFWDILIDNQGNVWAGSSGGLFVIDPDKLTYKTLFSTKELIEGNYPFILKEDKNNNIWIGHEDDISIIDSDRTFIKKIGKKEGLNVEIVVKLYEAEDGQMYLGNYAKGLSSISLEKETIYSLGKENGFFASALDIIPDAKGGLWLFQNDSIFLYKPNQETIKKVLLNAKIENGRLIATQYLEDNGLLWIGTVDKSILFLDSDGPLPEHFDSNLGLIGDEISAISQDSDDLIWLGTENGINIIDLNEERIRELGIQNKLVATANFSQSSNIHEIEPNKIFISQRGKGFSIIDKAKNTISDYSKNQGIPSLVMSSIKGQNDEIWFTSNDGIYVYYLDSGQVKKIGKNSGIISSGTGWWDIIDDKNGHYWIGTDEGLVVIDPLKNTVKYLGENEGLCHNEVLKIILDEDGLMWVATIKGISILDLDQNTITNLGEEEGLTPEDIYDLETHDHKVFAGSSDGLLVIEKPLDKSNVWNIVRYGKREGYHNSDYNQMTALKLKNDQIWWGISPNLSINTQIPSIEKQKPTLKITSIRIMDELVNFDEENRPENNLAKGDTLWSFDGSFYVNNNFLKKNKLLGWDSLNATYKLPLGLDLPFNRNVIQFSYANQDIKGRDKISYYYTLEGGGTSWSRNTTSTVSQNFYNLTHGEYTFKVYTKGFYENWSEAAEFHFIISPPWYQTWWAYLLFTMLAAGLVWGFVVIRSRKLVAENKLLEVKVNHRTKELNESLKNLKSTQSQLIQSEKMASLGELTSGIAHEIQNPLNFVNNFSEVSGELLDEVLEERSKDKRERDEELEGEILTDIKQNLLKVNHHGNRASSIVKGMLEHSKPSTGEKVPTDINALADEYLKLAHHAHMADVQGNEKAFQCDFKTDFDENLPKLNVIPQEIGRVLLNIINNAFWACSERSSGASTERSRSAVTNHQNASMNEAKSDPYKPLVTISTKLTANSQVLIAIKDNGLGIPENIKDKIFQPFFTTKPTGKGTGLGLSLAYDIVKAHSGELTLESEENKGTTFQIKLPID